MVQEVCKSMNQSKWKQFTLFTKKKMKLNKYTVRLKLDLSKYTEQHSFTFDDVFDLNCHNSIVYKRTALPLVHYIFKGGKATCFA